MRLGEKCYTIKSKLVSSNFSIKCVFNKFGMNYELNNLIDNKIDWKSNFTETSYDG